MVQRMPNKKFINYKTNYNMNLKLLITVLFITQIKLFSQSPTDALMMQKNQLCIAALYQNDSWNEYWEGTLLRDNQNIGTFRRNAISSMLAYGLSSKLSVILGLPYVSTKASGGQLVGTSSLQDLSLFIKANLYELKKSSGDFNAFVTGGLSFPATNYNADYLPFAVGLGATEYSLRAILKYEYKTNTYLRAGAGYYHRTEAEVERDFHYNDGPVYSNLMDVPSVYQYEVAIGQWFLNNGLQLELALNNQTGLSGDDIRRQNMPQPTNKMNFTNGNVYIRYFPRFVNGLSIMASIGQTFSGRNVGKSQGIMGGLTYQFYTCKKKNSTETN